MIILPSKEKFRAQRLAVVAFTNKLKKTAELVDWAKRELELAGLFDKDSDYFGMLGPSILEIIKIFADQGHSGFSASMSSDILNKLLRYEPLTPVNNPTETGDYIDCNDEYGQPHGVPLFQSTRDPSIFSDDNGKSWYKLVDDIYDEKFIDDDGSISYPSYTKCRNVSLDDYNKGIGHSIDYRKHNNE